MKALVLTEYNKMVILEVPIPEVGTDEVLVRIMAAGICGSDIHGMDGSTGRRIPPVIMGHEASGVIEAIGTSVVGWGPGDRVTFDSTIYDPSDWYSRRGLYNLSDNRKVLGVSCKEFRKNGAFAEYVTVPQHILYKLPDNVSFEHASMVEPVAVAMHALNLTSISLNDTVVVGGAGMIGLFVIQLLKLAGCGQIITFDLDQDRLDLALSLGATSAFRADRVDVAQEVRGLTNGRGADIGFEVVGTTTVLKTLVDSLRKGSQITLVGNISPVIDLPLQKVVTGQLKIQGSCAICGEYEQVLDLISRGLIEIDRMISGIVPLEEGAAWFSRLYNREKGLMKIILKP